jgi:ubiquinone/menaquinone biosynthesis C-methylase UbiE
MVFWYNLIARIDSGGEVLFMNHGFSNSSATPLTAAIPPELERYRYSIQLYDFLASKIDWRDKVALEVSSGLGGGVLWISTAYKPSTITGLDIAADAVHKCRERYGSQNVRFEHGDAQAMPFSDNSFDVVINIESSLNYPDMPAFLREVARIMRPGGYFLFGDYRMAAKMARLRTMLQNMRMKLILMEDITESIIHGLEYQESQKRELIAQKVPAFLRGMVMKFAGLDAQGDSERSLFLSREKTYIAAILQMPEAPDSDLDTQSQQS